MYGFIRNIGFNELLLILALALIIVGPGKLPEVGRSIGKSITEFKKATREYSKDDTEKEDDHSKK